jgi:hypothetical protein
MKTLMLALILSAGCTTREFTFGDMKYKSTRFGNKERIKSIEFRHGDDLIKIVGYSNDQVEALGIVTEAAVTAAIKSMK